MDSIVTETDVLIVGASVPGYIAAITLTNYGVRCRIIDKEPSSKRLGPSHCLQPRTLEILQVLGLRAPLEEQGSRVRETASWAQRNGQLCQESIGPWTDAAAPFPYDLVLNQGSIEACVERFLSSRGVVVDRSIEFVHFNHESDLGPPVVAAFVKNHVSGCIETWRTKFIIKSNGMDSDMPGFEVPESRLHSMTATLEAETDFPDHRRRGYIWSQGEGLILTPGQRGTYHVRILLSKPDIQRLNKNAVNNPAPTTVIRSEAMMEILQTRVRTVLAPYQLTIRRILFIGPSSTFKQIASQVCDWQHCIFPLGNSAHAHNLLDDHHVNLGVADAFNLTWKLAMVCKGVASRSILSTYSIEQQQLLLNQGLGLEAGFTPEEGHQFGFQEKQTLIATYHRQCAPNILIREEVRHQIKGTKIAPGRILTLPVVTRHSSGDEVSLLDEFASSGRFRLFIFAGCLLSHPIFQSLSLYLQKTSTLWSLNPSGAAKSNTATRVDHADVSAEVYLIHSSPHLNVSLANLPLPFTGSDRVYEDLSGKVHNSIGISQNLGGLILVRPDFVISIITNMADAPSVAKFMSTLSEL